MRWFILLLILSSGTTATAREVNWGKDWLQAERLTLDVGRYLVYRPAYAEQFNQEGWVGQVAVEFDLRIAPFLKWENMAHFEGTQVQARTTGWRHRVLIDYFDVIQPYYLHHSQHILEATTDHEGFPLEDRYGVRINFILPE